MNLVKIFFNLFKPFYFIIFYFHIKLFFFFLIADIYSLGLLFVEIYTGENPFYPLTFNFLLEFLEKLKIEFSSIH